MSGRRAVKRPNLKLLSVVPLAAILVASVYFYGSASTNPDYLGLATAPCIDSTKPTLVKYSLHVGITVDGAPVPLDPDIGHDYGNCMRAVYTNDSSGTVYIESQYAEKYTLGDLFNVWKKTFDQNQIGSHVAGNGKSISVVQNGFEVSTFEKTVMDPNDSIQIVYG